jgi:hypothetical protein
MSCLGSAELPAAWQAWFGKGPTLRLSRAHVCVLAHPISCVKELNFGGLSSTHSSARSGADFPMPSDVAAVIGSPVCSPEFAPVPSNISCSAGRAMSCANPSDAATDAPLIVPSSGPQGAPRARYLNHVPKSQIIVALEEAGPGVTDGGVEAMNKEALVVCASARLAGRRWLSLTLRKPSV